MPPPSCADEVGGGDADVGELDDRVVVADRVRVGGGADDGDAGAGQVDEEEQVLGGERPPRRDGAGSPAPGAAVGVGLAPRDRSG